MFKLGNPFHEKIEELFSDFDVVSILVALGRPLNTAIFFSGMGGMKMAGHLFWRAYRK